MHFWLYRFWFQPPEFLVVKKKVGSNIIYVAKPSKGYYRPIIYSLNSHKHLFHFLAKQLY